MAQVQSLIKMELNQVVSLMAKKRKLALTETTAIAQKAAALIGSTRAGRDNLTRVMGATKVIDTQGKQWNRYSP